MTLCGPGSIVATVTEFGSSAIPCPLCLLQLRVWVSQARQIRGARPGIQLFQQTVVTRLALQLGHSTVRVVQIAKNDRLRGTCLLAGGDDLTVLQRPILFFSLNFGPI